MKQNGHPEFKSMQAEVSESVTTLERFKEVLQEDYRVGDCSSFVFFNQDGTEITNDTFILVKDDEVVYYDPIPGSSFNFNNIMSQYEVLEKLGKGGFGSVHRGKHKKTGKMVAIKYMDVTAYSTTSFNVVYHASKLDEIYREAQALKRLSHGNIIQLYHAFLWTNNVILIMEYVPGGELRQYLNDKGKALSEMEAREFFLQITEAVDYCHNRGVIHRDLKLENLLLTDTPIKKIKACFINKVDN